MRCARSHLGMLPGGENEGVTPHADECHKRNVQGVNEGRQRRSHPCDCISAKHKTSLSSSVLWEIEREGSIWGHS